MPKYKKARATNLCLCVCDTSNIFLKKMYRKQTFQISKRQEQQTFCVDHLKYILKEDGQKKVC